MGPRYSGKITKDRKIASTRVIRHLAELSTKLSPLGNRMSSTLPPTAPARTINIPLDIALCRILDYADRTLANEPATGMNIVGDIPSSNALTAKFTPAAWGAPRLPRGLGRVKKRFSPA